jgi:hypothetical protein
VVPNAPPGAPLPDSSCIFVAIVTSSCAGSWKEFGIANSVVLGEHLRRLDTGR